MQPLSYLLFRKRWATKDNRKEGDQAFSHYRSFRFAPSFESRNRKVFDPRAKVKVEDAGPYADMWAAIYSHLVTARQAKSTLLRDAIFCCESILADRGYEPVTALRDVQPSPSARVSMLVPGCQTHKILRNRARVAADVYHRLSKNGFPTVCLLSGARPPKRRRVRIKDESGLLNRHFVEHLAMLQGKHVQDLDLENSLIARDVGVDPSSTATNSNVGAFVADIKHICEREHTAKQPQLIVVVSSTFHLIRLSQLLEQGLADVWKEPSLPPPDLQLLLVGAENVDGIDSPKTSPIVWNSSYAKSLFFEVFLYLAAEGVLPPYGEDVAE